MALEEEEEGKELAAAAAELADMGCCIQRRLCMRFGPWTLPILS